MRRRVQKADGDGAVLRTQCDEVCALVASRALNDEGARTILFPAAYWEGLDVDVRKLDEQATRIRKDVGGVVDEVWVAEIPNGAVGLINGIEKSAAGAERTVFWSKLAPQSLFVTTAKNVRESDDIVIVAQGSIGQLPKPHATPKPELAKALAREHQVKLLKADEVEERFVLGVVLEPNVVDSQNDFESPEDIRKAAHLFMEEYGELGTQHTEMVTGRLKVLESYIAPIDFEIGGEKVSKGTWVMGIRVVDDALWTDVKKGSFTGFSIGGTAYRSPSDQPAP